MSYLKIKGKDTHYNVSLNPFTSQHGYRAVRFIGDTIPTTNKGFEYYNDKNILITDLSDYKYEYRQNEYTVKEDIVIFPEGSDQPLRPSTLSLLISKVNEIGKKVVEMNSEVEDITPYTETKLAYVDDTEVYFDYKPGKITAYVSDGQIPCDVLIEDEIIKVSFDKLKEPAEVTISII